MRECTACQSQMPEKAIYCTNCGVSQPTPNRLIPVLIGCGAVLFFGLVAVVWLYNIVGRSALTGGRTGNAAPSAQDVQKAVDAALDFTKLSGSVRVVGIQESSKTNSPTVDLYFDNFQYNADSYGTPRPKAEKTPPPPDLNSPNWYRDTANTFDSLRRKSTMTGRGVALLKHYNDGRWLLTEVHLARVTLRV